MSMINEGDVIKSLIDRLRAVVGATWGTRVYSAGGLLTGKTKPYVVVGCFDSTNEMIQIPDTVRDENYLVFITCVAATPGQMDKYTFTGEVKNSLINSDIVIKDYSGESPVTVDTKALMNIDTSDQIFEGIAQKDARSAREITGTIEVFQTI